MTSTDGFNKLFRREFAEARVEWLRLGQLFKEACWYNFETVCRDWREPWNTTYADTRVHLCGMKFHYYYNKGKRREHGHFPVYYSGPVSEAPILPPEILYKEFVAARAYMEFCEQQLTACEDWAPGGRKYKCLQNTTFVGKELVRRKSGGYRIKRKFSQC